MSRIWFVVFIAVRAGALSAQAAAPIPSAISAPVSDVHYEVTFTVASAAFPNLRCVQPIKK